MPWRSRKSLGVGLNTLVSTVLWHTSTGYLDRKLCPTRSASHREGVISRTLSGGSAVKSSLLRSQLQRTARSPASQDSGYSLAWVQRPRRAHPSLHWPHPAYVKYMQWPVNSQQVCKVHTSLQ